MPAFAATAAILLYSSAAFFTSSSVGLLPAAEGRGDHLRDADVLRPGDALLLVLAQLPHAEVRALALHAVIGQDLPDLFPVGETGELGVADRRAQLDALTPMSASIFSQPGEVASLIICAVGIRLAADRQAQRIGAKLGGARGDKPGMAASVAVFWKNSRRDRSVMQPPVSVRYGLTTRNRMPSS